MRRRNWEMIYLENIYLENCDPLGFRTAGHASLLQAIYDATLYAKLEDTAQRTPFRREWLYGCDGRQLALRLEGDRVTIASYTLDRYRTSLKWLAEHGWIVQDRRHTGPYGYGDDEYFFPARKALDALKGGEERVRRNMVTDHFKQHEKGAEE